MPGRLPSPVPDETAVAPSSQAPAVEPATPVQPCASPAGLEAASDMLDRELHAAAAALTGGLSPSALTLAFADWLIHLATSPGKQMQLAAAAASGAARLAEQVSQLSPHFRPWSVIAPTSVDRRFAGADWNMAPYNMVAQGFLLAEQWWQAATNVRGVARDHAAITAFTLRQILDTVAPSNSPLTNPEVVRKTLQTGGKRHRRIQQLAAGYSGTQAGWQRRSRRSFCRGRERGDRTGPGRVPQSSDRTDPV